MFASAADALVGLLEGRVDNSTCRITRMSSGIARLTNGIKYYAVEVTSDSGMQYGISAYDDEAQELYETALRRAPAIEMPMVVSKS